MRDESSRQCGLGRWSDLFQPDTAVECFRHERVSRIASQLPDLAQSLWGRILSGRQITDFDSQLIGSRDQIFESHNFV